MMMITQTDTGSLKQLGDKHKENWGTIWGGFLVTVGAIGVLGYAAWSYINEGKVEIFFPAIGVSAFGLVIWLIGKVSARV